MGPRRLFAPADAAAAGSFQSIWMWFDIMAHKFIPLALTAALALASYSHSSEAGARDNDDCCGDGGWDDAGWEHAGREDAGRGDGDRARIAKNLADRKRSGHASLKVERVLLAGAV